jgi:hypothetical protein
MDIFNHGVWNRPRMISGGPQIWRALRRFPAEPAVRTAHELDDPGLQDDEVIRLARARVVLADVDAVLRDFAALGPSDPAARDRVVRWLLAHAAVITPTQAAQTIVNTAIPVDGGPIHVVRPTHYGRAVVAPVLGGMLDVKGAGVARGRVPSTALHGNGLMQLGEAIQELVHQWIIDAILGHATRGRLCSLPSYALIDPGFDVRTVDGRLVPAGIIVRRAHRRPRDGIELPVAGSGAELIKLEIEMLLRQYGVTSCNNGTVLELSARTGEPAIHYGEFPAVPLARLSPGEQQLIRELTRYHDDRVTRRFEIVNIQLCRDLDADASRATIVDFGHFRLKPHFEAPVVSPVRGRAFRWGGALWPDHPHYVQPHPRLCVSLPSWPGATAWQLGDAFRAGELSGGEIYDRMLGAVDEATRAWPGRPSR